LFTDFPFPIDSSAIGRAVQALKIKHKFKRPAFQRGYSYTIGVGCPFLNDLDHMKDVWVVRTFFTPGGVTMLIVTLMFQMSRACSSVYVIQS
jgi:hypothetical protein